MKYNYIRYKNRIKLILILIYNNNNSGSNTQKIARFKNDLCKIIIIIIIND